MAANNGVTVIYRGPVAILTMKRGENRVNVDFLRQFLAALHEIESNKTVKALVTTGEGKFYSNGLDLDTLATYNEEELNEFDRLYQAVHKTILTFPMITIACLNGHAFAAGGILALAHDVRVMKKERGWFSLPEIKIYRSFTISTMEIVKAKLPHSEFTDSILMGRRYTGEEAKVAGIVQAVYPGDKLLDFAVSKAEAAAKENLDYDTMGQLKNALYYTAVESLTKPNIYHAKL